MSRRVVPTGNLWPISFIMKFAKFSILFGVPPIQTNCKKTKAHNIERICVCVCEENIWARETRKSYIFVAIKSDRAIDKREKRARRAWSRWNNDVSRFRLRPDSSEMSKIIDCNSKNKRAGQLIRVVQVHFVMSTIVRRDCRIDAERPIDITRVSCDARNYRPTSCVTIAYSSFLTQMGERVEFKERRCIGQSIVDKRS